MAGLGEHPRLARLVLAAERLGAAPLGCMLASLLSEGDFLRNAAATADVRARLRMVLDPAGSPGAFPPPAVLLAFSRHPLALLSSCQCAPRSQKRCAQTTFPANALAGGSGDTLARC